MRSLLQVYIKQDSATLYMYICLSTYSCIIDPSRLAQVLFHFFFLQGFLYILYTLAASVFLEYYEKFVIQSQRRSEKRYYTSTIER